VVPDVRGRAGGEEVRRHRLGRLVAREGLERGRHRGGERVRGVAAVQRDADRGPQLRAERPRVAGRLGVGAGLDASRR
jgi:hypothetical protein